MALTRIFGEYSRAKYTDSHAVKLLIAAFAAEYPTTRIKGSRELTELTLLVITATFAPQPSSASTSARPSMPVPPVTTTDRPVKS